MLQSFEMSNFNLKLPNVSLVSQLSDYLCFVNAGAYETHFDPVLGLHFHMTVIFPVPWLGSMVGRFGNIFKWLKYI